MSGSTFADFISASVPMIISCMGNSLRVGRNLNPLASTLVSSSVQSTELKLITASSLYLTCVLSCRVAIVLENFLLNVFILVKYSLSWIFFRCRKDNLYVSLLGYAFISRSNKNSFACNVLSISLIRILENLNSIWFDLVVEIRDLDRKPFGDKLNFRHLVKKLIVARVAPIRL